MKASSTAKLIWETYHFIRPFFLFSLSLVSRNPLLCSRHFSVFLIPTSSMAFPRLVKKRRSFPPLVVLRFPFPVLSRQVLRESLPSILSALFFSMAYFTTIHLEILYIYVCVTSSRFT